MLILMEHDLELAIEFYEKLGLSLVFHLPKQWAEFEVNGVKIGLCPTTTRVENKRTGFVFEVTDIKKVYETYKNELTFVSEPLEKLHGLMVSLVDPGGNIIDLYQPTPERVHELVDQAKEVQ